MAEAGVKGVSDRTPPTASIARGYRGLRYAAFLFTAALLLHGADHLRRGFDVLTPEVYWGGMALTLMALAATTAAITGHRRAPLVAIAAGFATALLVAASHLLPRWSAFSDAFPGSAVDSLSWAAVLGEIAAALAFGAAGAYALRGCEQIDRPDARVS